MKETDGALRRALLVLCFIFLFFSAFWAQISSQQIPTRFEDQRTVSLQRQLRAYMIQMIDSFINQDSSWEYSKYWVLGDPAKLYGYFPAPSDPPGEYEIFIKDGTALAYWYNPVPAVRGRVIDASQFCEGGPHSGWTVRTDTNGSIDVSNDFVIHRPRFGVADTWWHEAQHAAFFRGGGVSVKATPGDTDEHHTYIIYYGNAAINAIQELQEVEKHMEEINNNPPKSQAEEQVAWGSVLSSWKLYKKGWDEKVVKLSVGEQNEYFRLAGVRFPEPEELAKVYLQGNYKHKSGIKPPAWALSLTGDEPTYIWTAVPADQGKVPETSYLSVDVRSGNGRTKKGRPDSGTITVALEEALPKADFTMELEDKVGGPFTTIDPATSNGQVWSFDLAGDKSSNQSYRFRLALTVEKGQVSTITEMHAKISYSGFAAPPGTPGINYVPSTLRCAIPVRQQKASIKVQGPAQIKRSETADLEAYVIDEKGTKMAIDPKLSPRYLWSFFAKDDTKGNPVEFVPRKVEVLKIGVKILITQDGREKTLAEGSHQIEVVADTALPADVKKPADKTLGEKTPAEKPPVATPPPSAPPVAAPGAASPSSDWQLSDTWTSKSVDYGNCDITAQVTFSGNSALTASTHGKCDSASIKFKHTWQVPPKELKAGQALVLDLNVEDAGSIWGKGTGRGYTAVFVGNYGGSPGNTWQDVRIPGPMDYACQEADSGPLWEGRSIVFPATRGADWSRNLQDKIPIEATYKDAAFLCRGAGKTAKKDVQIIIPQASGQKKFLLIIAGGHGSRVTLEETYSSDTSTAGAHGTIYYEYTNTMGAFGVSIAADKPTPKLGDTVTLSAQVTGGTAPYTYTWTGPATGTSATLPFTVSKPGRHDFIVIVVDAKGAKTSAAASVEAKAFTATISLTGGSLPVRIGQTLSFQGQVSSPDGAAPPKDLVYRWQPNPEVTFTPFEGTKNTTTGRFPKIGNVKVWVDVLQKSGTVLSTIAESNQLEIKVVAPEISLRSSPAAPYPGQEVRITESESPAVGDAFISFWWEYTGNAISPGALADPRVYAYKPKDTTLVTVTVHAKAKDGGDDLGQKSISVTAKPYEVKIGEPRLMGPPPRVWSEQAKGLVEVPRAIGTFQDFFVNAIVSPPPPDPSLRYAWQSQPERCSIYSPGSQETRGNASQAGTFTISVTVRDSQGATLGSGARTVTIVAPTPEPKKTEPVKPPSKTQTAQSPTAPPPGNNAAAGTITSLEVQRGPGNIGTWAAPPNVWAWIGVTKPGGSSNPFLNNPVTAVSLPSGTYLLFFGYENYWNTVPASTVTLAVGYADGKKKTATFTPGSLASTSVWTRISGDSSLVLGSTGINNVDRMGNAAFAPNGVADVVLQFSDRGGFNVLPPTPGKPLTVSINPAQQTVTSGEKLTTTTKVLGGTPPYRYEWFNGDNRSDVTSGTITWTLNAAGPRTFKVIVTDAANIKAEAYCAAQVVSPGPSLLKSGQYHMTANGMNFVVILAVNGSTFEGKMSGDVIKNGVISGDTVTFHRDCYGFPQGQDYKGRIQGNKIVGTFTGAGGEPGKTYPWEIDLTPVTSNQPSPALSVSVSPKDKEMNLGEQLLTTAAVARERFLQT